MKKRQRRFHVAMGQLIIASSVKRYRCRNPQANAPLADRYPASFVLATHALSTVSIGPGIGSENLG